MYRVATDLIRDRWGDAEAVADALGVLLLTWNQAFYRYGFLDCGELETFVKLQQDTIERYRGRELASLVSEEREQVDSMFRHLLEASRATSPQTGKQRRSPVSVGKAMHGLAPRFFPLWDREIARRYGCGWHSLTGAGGAYWSFMLQQKLILQDLGDERTRREIERGLSERARFPKTLVKFLDEFNYAQFTKRWIL